MEKFTYIINLTDGTVNVLEGVALEVDESGALWIYGDTDTIIAVYADGVWITVKK